MNIARFLFAVLCATALTACSHEEPSVRQSDQTVQFAAVVDSRVTGVSWELNDMVGIYMKPATGNFAASNSKYKVPSGGATASFQPAAADQTICYPMTGDVTFYAYHPWAEAGTGAGEVESTGTTAVYHATLADQSAQGAVDLLRAVSAPVSKQKTAVPMVFEHMLCKVTVNLTPEDAGRDLSGMTVKMKGIPTLTDVDLVTGTESLPVDWTGNDVTMHASTDGAQYQAVVSRHTPIPLTFEFALGDDIYVWDWEDAGGAGFTTGHNHIFDITISHVGPTFTGATIADWSQGSSGSGDGIPADDSFTVTWPGHEGLITSVEMVDATGNKYVSDLDADGKTIDFAAKPASVSSISIWVDGGSKALPLGGDYFDFDASAGTVVMNNGLGTKAVPSLVTSIAELEEVGNNISKYFLQVRDIDLGSVPNWVPIGDDNAPFTGGYDGSGYKIGNMIVNMPAAGHAGLFGCIESATLKNINIGAGSSVTAGYCAGGICGSMKKADGSSTPLIENCSSVARIETTSGSDAKTGGICGSNSGGQITGCNNTGTVTASGRMVGGICGFADITASRIEDCTNMGAVTTTVTGSANIGGVCGYLAGSDGFPNTVLRCSNSGRVSGKSTNIGGICGKNTSGWLTLCTNSGVVEADQTDSEKVGGVCGENKGHVNGCLNKGEVKSPGKDVGGVCGKSDKSITASKNTAKVTGKDHVGGVCGNNYNATVMACVNQGQVISKGEMVGGVCGFIIGGSAVTKACYSTGKLTSTGAKAYYIAYVNEPDDTPPPIDPVEIDAPEGSAGTEDDLNKVGTLAYCYWTVVVGSFDTKEANTGITSSAPFGNGTGGTLWPVNNRNNGWGVFVNESSTPVTDGYYWSDLGRWNGGNPVYPKLWWEPNP